MLGICNGFQVLAEAGLVPGALLRNASLRFEHRLGAPVRGAARHAVHAAIPVGTTLRMPIAHGEGNYFLPDADLDALESRRGVAVPLHRARRATPTAPRGTSRASSTPRHDLCGLMPHPERAAEAILGSDDGMLLFRSIVESVGASTVREPPR